jgi:hypothetical protein
LIPCRRRENGNRQLVGKRPTGGAQVNKKKEVFHRGHGGHRAELKAAMARGEAAGQLSMEDMRFMLQHMNTLIVTLYDEYKEFEGVTTMVQGALLTVSEQTELRTEQRLQKEFNEERRQVAATSPLALATFGACLPACHASDGVAVRGNVAVGACNVW